MAESNVYSPALRVVGPGGPGLRVVGTSASDLRRKDRQLGVFIKRGVNVGLNAGSLLILLLGILLLVNIFAYFTGSADRTVLGLLTSLQKAPTISLDWLNWAEVNLGDWGIFNWLRDFINYFIDSVSVLGFLGGSLVNAIIFIVWFLKWVLLGV